MIQSEKTTLCSNLRKRVIICYSLKTQKVGFPTIFVIDSGKSFDSWYSVFVYQADRIPTQPSKKTSTATTRRSIICESLCVGSVEVMSSFRLQDERYCCFFFASCLRLACILHGKKINA